MRDNNTAIVLSAGKGKRMNSDIPKQYLELCGRPVIAWSLKAFQDFDKVDSVVLVTSDRDIEYCRNEIVDRYGFTKVTSIIPGGAERYLSVWEGLKEIQRKYPKTDGSIVFIHDGARPMVDHAILTRTLEAAEAFGACVAGMPARDTIKIADEEGFADRTPDRRYVWQIQTPQVFSFPLIYRAYESLIREGFTAVTDDAMVLERQMGSKVKLVEGSVCNIKITTPEDLKIAELFLNGRD